LYCHVPSAVRGVHVAHAAYDVQVVPAVSVADFQAPLTRMSMLSFVAAGILYHMQMYG
jgi:hypothetical protein